jgi:hypothetical protein
MSYQRIATEEAFATADLFDCYRQIIENKSVDDPGFFSLWGHFRLNKTEWPAAGCWTSMTSASPTWMRAVLHGKSFP